MPDRPGSGRPLTPGPRLSARVGRLVLGVGCVVLGAAITLRPFTSLGVLVILVAGSFFLSGLSELSAARDAARPRVAVAVGVGWGAAGALVLAWAGITIHALAIVAGISLVAGGITRLSGARRDRPEDRLTVSLGGVAGVIFGLLALAWPDVTVLVLALLLGARTVIFGSGQILEAAWPRSERRAAGRQARGRRTPRWLRITGAGVAVLLALALMAVSAVLHRASTTPDAFYTPPRAVPSRPGVLVRLEPLTRAIPSGGRAWRILYTTTRDDGIPAVASGIVVIRRSLPPGPRPVIAWAHGTTGVASACAPSLLASRFGADVIPGLDQVIERGWILVATDYIGLGTAGPHPYLIGQGEARSVLDSVRAARSIPGLAIGRQTVVWGHSQGGHAALWAGALASSYALDVHVVGVAAIAPASDLPALVEEVKDTLEGRIIGSYILSAYSDIYPDVSFDRYVRPAARVVVREMAKRCLDIPEAIPSAITAIVSRQSLYSADPLSGALGERLRENTPTGRIAAPVLVAQGLGDPLVTPRVQQRYVEERCGAGQSLTYRTYENRDHLSILAPGSRFVSDLLSWTRARLAGRRAPTGCRMIHR